MLGHYWIQTDWNEYTLKFPNGSFQTFKTYDALYRHCQINGINAKQV